MPFENPVKVQLPDFMMTGPRIHPSRLQQVNTGNGGSYGQNTPTYESSIKANDTLSTAHTRSLSPTASVITTTTQAHPNGQNQGSSGVFARCQPLPLAFHVLAGPM